MEYVFLEGQTTTIERSRSVSSVKDASRLMATMSTLKLFEIRLFNSWYGSMPLGEVLCTDENPAIVWTAMSDSVVT